MTSTSTSSALTTARTTRTRTAPSVASAQAVSTAPPSAFFDRWADMATWPDWNTDLAWVRLDGPFVEGATGKLQPKSGPTVRFVVERLVPGHEFVDVSMLPGARLVFAHQVTSLDGGRTRLDVTASLRGPLAWLWTRLMGAGLRTGLQGDLDRLVVTAEADVAAAAADE